jgi:hypothetical protein
MAWAATIAIARLITPDKRTGQRVAGAMTLGIMHSQTSSSATGVISDGVYGNAERKIEGSR